ncbi:hypothetical protein STRTUCAR8_01959 [Streptomyces turgidiscabies Car8]|uniref:Uncharacterized protein n=1 Tax=Streptomyces turgidiscabies (strain Car8) TaxID=698760 RepID=L7F5E1_STRT8|nr:hypothetical protein STRTUCAR8_01959 [Streptomyces turgidiscabies Car8]
MRPPEHGESGRTPDSPETVMVTRWRGRSHRRTPVRWPSAARSAATASPYRNRADGKAVAAKEERGRDITVPYGGPSTRRTGHRQRARQRRPGEPRD